MGTGRDDFTQDTVRKAAMRVAYHCSFPHCNAATVGASLERNDKPAVTGVAAHICAAAKGGPRYDPNMTPEMRRSIDNCIWLCQTHARLIDTDTKKYTVELLRSWKQNAEAEASAALAEIDYFSEHYKRNRDNLSVIRQLLDDMIIDGQYEQLHLLLSQYKAGSLSEVYDEFILRYMIIYDCYCCRVALKDDLEKYIILPCKNGVEELAKLFVAFLMRDELQVIQKYCKKDELVNLVAYTISGELESNLFTTRSANSILRVSPEFSEIIRKAVMNDVRIRKVGRIVDQAGKPFKVYEDEFYYKVIASVHVMCSMYRYDNASIERIAASKECAYIKENLGKIISLDNELQEYIWSNTLGLFVSNEEQFEYFYRNCPDAIKETVPVIKARYYSLVLNNNPALAVDELERFAHDNRCYDVLALYLAKLTQEEAATYLDERRYLLGKDSRLLLLRIVTLNDLSIEERHMILRQYADQYVNDSLYHCLVANLSTDEAEIESQFEWLKKNQHLLDEQSFMAYLSALNKHKKWEEIYNITELEVGFPNECLYQLATCLAASDMEKYYLQAEEIYKALLDERHWKRDGIFFHLGIINQKMGRFEAAKSYYKQEYDEYKSADVLILFQTLCLETNEDLEDVYLAQLKGLKTARAQNLVGVAYYKRKNYTEARKYFIRSLLLDDKENPSTNGLFQISFCEEGYDSPKEVIKNTVVVIRNDTGIRRIAIHAHDTINGITPNGFADCEHVSEEDPAVSQLLFCKIGDQVLYHSQEYWIESICSIHEWFIKAAFSSIISKPNTITINGSSPEEALKSVAEVVRSTSQNLDQLIKNYNDASIRWPLSILSGNAGKRMLLTCEFLLYENTERVRNNLNVVQEMEEKPTFIFAYDSLVILAHLGLSAQEFGNIKLVCAQQVRNQLINDIDEELRELTSINHVAGMYYIGGSIKVLEYTSENRRERLAFLTRLKSIVEAIECPSPSFDYIPHSHIDKNTVADAIIQKSLLCESGTLGLAQNLENTYIVTDDQFLYSIAWFDHIRSVGVLGLFAYAFSEWDRLLGFSKKLHDMNFANYLPFFFYKTMVDKLISTEKDLGRGSDAIQKWIISDTENEPNPFHEEVISTLANDVYESGEEYLNPESILYRVATMAIERRNPGFLQDYINTIFPQMNSDTESDSINSSE